VEESEFAELAMQLRWAFEASIVTHCLLPFVLGKWTPLPQPGPLVSSVVATTTVIKCP